MPKYRYRVRTGRKKTKMKTSIKYILPVLTLSGLAVMIAHRSAADPTVIITAPAPPTVIVNPPAPVVVAAVPDYYAWDGYEYVGVVGDQYYYLGPGDVWIVCDPVRLGRFHTWEKGHSDWRTHAIHNVKYRNVDRAHSPPQPMHENKPAPAPQHAPPVRDNQHVPPAHDDQRDHSDHDHNGPSH